MADTGLDVRDLSAGYGGAAVVTGVSLSVPGGGALAIFGRNGAGKTTLINAIAGRAPSAHGEIRLNGHRLDGLRPSGRNRRGLALVPQDRQIFPSLTVEEHLRVATRGPSLDAAYTLFPRLAARRQTLGSRLSGGEQQMLAIARALVGAPTCLLLDEPFEGLAPVVIDELIAALHVIRRDGLALVIVEHHARLAMDLVDAAAVVELGRITMQGTRPHLLARWDEVEARLALAARGASPALHRDG